MKVNILYTFEPGGNPSVRIDVVFYEGKNEWDGKRRFAYAEGGIGYMVKPLLEALHEVGLALDVQEQDVQALWESDKTRDEFIVPNCIARDLVYKSFRKKRLSLDFWEYNQRFWIEGYAKKKGVTSWLV